MFLLPAVAFPFWEPRHFSRVKSHAVVSFCPNSIFLPIKMQKQQKEQSLLQAVGEK